MIHRNHAREFSSSKIDPVLASLNFISLTGDDAYQYLIPNITEASERVHPDAQWRWARAKYSHIEAGGWWCAGIDPTKGFRVGKKTPIQLFAALLQKNFVLAFYFLKEYSSPIPSLWGCFKPNTPRRDYQDRRKIIKYEHPPKTPTQLFCLDISPDIWRKICDRLQVEMPQVEATDKENSCGIQFWEWVLEHPELPIILTEGAKKAAALLSAGYIAIALPGINSGYRTVKDEFGRSTSQRHLIEQLQVFAKPSRTIYFAFDQDAKYKTRINCDKAIEKTAILLERQHQCKTLIINWSMAKGVDDFLVAFGEVPFHKCYTEAVKFIDWQLTKLNKLNYCSQQINQAKIGNLTIPRFAKIIGLKSAKGTGKTEFFVRIVEQAHLNLQRVLVITHRVQLGEALAARFGIPYVTEIRDKDGSGELLGYALCVDSLHGKSKAKFNPNDWHNAIIIIDEAEQVLWHTLNAKTEVSRNRITILKNLQTLIANVLNSPDGKVYLADADLTDISINWIKSFASFDIEPHVIANNFKPDSGKAFVYIGKQPAGLVMELENQIEQNKKVLVCCTGQRVYSKWGTQVLERKFKARFPHLRILRIDSESVSDPSHPAFGCISHLNEILLGYDLVIASPSIETGVSIDIVGHFDSVFGIFQGVQPDTSVRQALARLRETVDRHVWIAPTGLNFAKIGNGSVNPKALIACENKQLREHSLLMANLLRADAIQQQDLAIDSKFQSPTLDAWGARGAIINAGFIHYRDTVIKGLIEDGYSIHEVVELEDISHITEEVKAIRDQVYQQEREAIANAEPCDEIEYQKIKDKRAKTKEERYRQRKTELIERYGIEVTPELIEKDDAGWYKQLRLQYFLTVGNEFLLEREKQFIVKQVQAGEGYVWKPDFNKKAILPIAKIYEALNIMCLLNPDKEWKDGDNVVESIAKLAIEHRFMIKDYLGITISDKNTSIRIIQKLLEKMGLRLEYTNRKEGGRGNQKRIYKYKSYTDERDEVFQVWLERDQERYAPVVTTSNIAA